MGFSLKSIGRAITKPFESVGKAVESTVKDVGVALGLRSPKEDPSIAAQADAQAQEIDRFYTALRMREDAAMRSQRTQVDFGQAGVQTDLSALTLGSPGVDLSPLAIADDTYGVSPMTMAPAVAPEPVASVVTPSAPVTPAAPKVTRGPKPQAPIGRHNRTKKAMDDYHKRLAAWEAQG